MKSSNTLSRQLSGGLFATLLGLVSFNTVSAQVVWTNNGTITSFSGFDGSLTNGGAFTETISFTSSGLGFGLVVNGVEYLTFTPQSMVTTINFGNYTFTDTATSQSITLLEPGPQFGQGYHGESGVESYNQTWSSQNGLTNIVSNLELVSNNPSIRSVTLPPQVLPVSDFNLYQSMELSDQNDNIVNANITSFSVTTIPEPSTWTLLLGGLGLLAFWRVRTRRALV